MDIIRRAVKVGNSSGVILPKRLLGSQVKISVVNLPLNVKKEVFRHIDFCLKEIQGLYITSKRPVEVLAISTNTKKMITTGKMKINIIPLSQIKKDLLNESLKKKLVNAEVILNQALLSELKKL